MTVPFRALLSRIGCRAFPYYRDWLPARERTLCKVRLIGPLYRALRECAAWFSIADTLAAADGVTIDEWLGSDGDPRLVRMLFALTQRDARLGEDASAPLLRLVEAALSRLVLGVRRAARDAGLVPTAEAVQLALDGFRQRRALLDQAAALAWAAEWSLSASDLAETMELELLRGALVLPGRADLVGDHPPLAPRHWLSEVWDWLRLEPLWRSIDRPRELGWLAERYRCVSEGEANERDFADGLGGYQLDAAAMAS